jgi:hypothetical protein
METVPGMVVTQHSGSGNANQYSNLNPTGSDQHAFVLVPALLQVSPA